MTLVSCWVLVLPSLFAKPTLSSLDPDGRHAVRPTTGLFSKHCDNVQPCCDKGSRWTRLSPPSVGLAGCGFPWENGYKEVFWRLAVNGVRTAGACKRYFSAQCPCGVVGSGVHGDSERLQHHAFWEFAIAQAVRTQVQRGLGGALLQQWRLWLIDPPPVCEMVWRVVVLAAILAMEQGRKRLWSLVHTPPTSRQGSAVEQAISKASTSNWSACMIMIGQRAVLMSALSILSCLLASRFPCTRA
jgi:hypothetical protein